MEHLSNICAPMKKQSKKIIWQQKVVKGLFELKSKNLIIFVQYIKHLQLQNILLLKLHMNGFAKK